MAASPLMLALCVVFLAYRYISNSIANSPLSKIPDAHPTSAFSAIWILWIRYCGKENVTVWEAHKRLGPMVRLGPNEISVNCVDGGIRSVSADVHAQATDASYIGSTKYNKGTPNFSFQVPRLALCRSLIHHEHPYKVVLHMNHN